MGWLPDPAEGETPFDREFGRRPNLYQDYRRFCAVFWEERLLDPMLLELCRLRVAELHGCESELRLRYRPAREAGLGEEKVAQLSRSAVSPLFSPLERDCLALAELFVADPHAIRDEDVATVSEALGPAGTVALVQALAVFDGFARFRLVLGVDPPDAPALTVPAPAGASESLY